MMIYLKVRYAMRFSGLQQLYRYLDALQVRHLAGESCNR